jgi:hypothetical protein
MLHLSISTTDCENYLFEDYHLKSNITTLILTLKSSGRKREHRECGQHLHQFKQLIGIEDDWQKG